MNAIQDAIKANNQKDAYNAFYQTLPENNNPLNPDYVDPEKHLFSIVDEMDVMDAVTFCSLLIKEATDNQNYDLVASANWGAKRAIHSDEYDEQAFLDTIDNTYQDLLTYKAMYEHSSPSEDSLKALAEIKKEEYAEYPDFHYSWVAVHWVEKMHKLTLDAMYDAISNIYEEALIPNTTKWLSIIWDHQMALDNGNYTHKTKIPEMVYVIDKVLFKRKEVEANLREDMISNITEEWDYLKTQEDKDYFLQAANCKSLSKVIDLNNLQEPNVTWNMQ